MGPHRTPRGRWKFANEPLDGSTANAVFVPYYQACHVVDGAPNSARLVALALHAATDIADGEEITVRYSPPGKSDTYAPQRAIAGYIAGKQAKLRWSDIPPNEWPARHLGAAAPPTALFPW